MELIIGGYAQGKKAYAMGKYPNASLCSPEELTQWNDPERLEKEIEVQMQSPIIFYGVHRLIKNFLKYNSVEEMKEWMHRLVEQYPDAVWISDEIGNGIVPMEKEERIWREETGRMLIEIAAKAESVERVICGLPQRIK